MKSIRYLLVFVLLCFIAWFLFNNAPKNVVKTTSLKQRTSQEQTGVTEKIKSSVKKQDSNKPQIEEPLEQNTTDIQQKKDKTVESDYVSAYRDWQYFENCYTDVEDFNNKTDPLQTLADRFKNNNRESQSEPTAQQNSYYQYHVELCKSLISVAGDVNDYYLIHQRLKDRYEKITPKTDEEKQLAHAQSLIQQLNTFKLEYSQAMRSQSSLPADELNVIHEQINSLSDELLSIYEEGEELSEQQIADIQKITHQIDTLNARIRASSAPDTQKLAQITAKIDGHLNSIDDYLHHVQSPDAFLLLAKALYKVEYFSKESTVLKNFKAETGIYDGYYINILNQIVLPLVACSMDYPCDAQSDLILSYCLGLRDSMFNQACGRDLEDFYFNYYIGGNQLNDVNVYFNYLVNKYAQ